MAETSRPQPSHDQIAALKDVATIIALLVAAMWLANSGQEAMAGSALGGALTLAMPSKGTGGPRIPPLAAGLALGALVGAAGV